MQTFKRIMLVCTANICRSPMALAVMRAGLRTSGANMEVVSAGLQALGGHAADPLANRLMEERGLDLGEHVATQFTAADGLGCDLILVMETTQRRIAETRWPLLRGRIYRLGHWGKFDVDDPYERGEAAFRKALDAIDTGVAQWCKLIAP